MISNWHTSGAKHYFNLTNSSNLREKMQLNDKSRTFDNMKYKEYLSYLQIIMSFADLSLHPASCSKPTVVCAVIGSRDNSDEAESDSLMYSFDL